MATYLVIILSSDWVGSTQARAQLGEDTADAVQEVHDTLLRRGIAAEDGKVVKHYGDGVLATFKSATAALGAAARIQADFAAYRESPDALTHMEVRVGLSAGDVKHQGGDIFGLPVVEAVRLQGAAGPNEILCSDLVRVLSQGRGGFEFEAAGDLELKGLPAPVRVLKVRRPETPATRPAPAVPALPVPRRTLPILAAVLVLVLIAVFGYVAWRDGTREEPAGLETDPSAGQPALESPAPAAPSRLPNSIAVLPFADMSPDQDQEYFADGLTEELINQLVQIPGMLVIGRTSSFSFKGKDTDLRTIGQTLGVNHILEGSVRKAGNQIRINAKLIDARSGMHAWSQTYERDLDDIFAIQTDIGLKVVDALAAEFPQAGRAPVAKLPTQSIEAYTLYLEAQGLFGRAGLPLILEKINRAVELDPEFVEAWLYKARIHGTIQVIFPEQSAQQIVAQKEAVQRAQALAPNSPEVYEARAALAGRDWLQAQMEINKAIALGGSDPSAITVNLNANVGYIEKTLQMALEVQKLNPLHIGISRSVMTAYFNLGNIDAAMKEYARAKTFINEIANSAHITDATIGLLENGAVEQARQLIRDDAPENKLFRTVLIDSGQALTALRGFYDDEAYTHPYLRINIAALAAFLGDQQLALLVIKEYLAGSGIVSFIWQPVFRDVRQLDEFKDIMRDIGLVEYWRQYGWPDLCQPVVADDFQCR